MARSGKIALLLIFMLMCSLGMRAYHRSDYYSKSKSVKLELEGFGQCSGEQIVAPSGHTYILTAAHCKELRGDKNSITVSTEDGTKLERAIIAEDLKSDLLLLEGIPDKGGLSIADSSYQGQHVRTFTHGHGFPTYESQGALVGNSHVHVMLGIIGINYMGSCKGAKYKIIDIDAGFMVVQACTLDVEETASTAFIVPGSSGGMIVNDSGELVGVVSAGDGVFGYFVKLSDIQDFLEGY